MSSTTGSDPDDDFLGIPLHAPHTHMPWHEPLIEWHQGHGWYQGRRKLHNFHSRKYFVRPIDGARRGHWGRVKDALTNSGPDVFVVATGDRRTFHRDRPHREHWSNWDATGLPAVLRWDGLDPREYPPRLNLGDVWYAHRPHDTVYNFRTRKYEPLRRETRHQLWSDARWHNGERRKNHLPLAFRNADGTWIRPRPFPGPERRWWP